METNKMQIFNKLSFFTLVLTIFLSIFFFIPYLPITLPASKGFLIHIGATLALVFWLISRLIEGKFVFAKDKIMISAVLIPFIFLISSFFSSSIRTSLFGNGFEIGTFGSMLVLFIIFFLSSIYFKTENRAKYFFISLIIGGVILSVFQFLNLFIGFDRFLPGLLQGLSNGNLVGDWNNFSLIFGLLILLATFSIDILNNNLTRKIILYFLLLSGMFFLVVTNIPLVWLLVGLFSVVLFVYNIFINHSKRESENGENRNKFPVASLIVVFISLIFLIGSNSLGVLVSRYINISNPDIRPSITTTAKIAYESIKHNPVLGSGPNTFNISWSLWKPDQVVNTDFWNVDFNSGYSTLTTFLVTSGILGFLAFILFIILFITKIIQSVKISFKDSSPNYPIIMTLVAGIYSWILFVIYNPNIIITTIAFSSVGILVGLLVGKGSIEEKEISFLNDPRASFFSILSLMVLIILSISLTYVYVEKFTSLIYFSRSINSSNDLDSLIKSERILINAITLDKNDIYYRNLSQIYVAQIRNLVSDPNVSEDILKSSLQQIINLSQESASLAIRQNPKYYVNYVNLGNIYSYLSTLEVEGSYNKAIEAYDKAMELSSNNPSIVLLKSELDFLNKNIEGAKGYAQKALELKSNYIDAIFLLAQIETSEGNLSEAIKQAEIASQMSPNNSTVFFRLGLLRYNNSDYKGAVSAFERSVILNNGYLNARYYLGLAYQKVGRKDDAMTQFNILSTILPENEEVKEAIDSISKNIDIKDVKNEDNESVIKPPLEENNN